MARSSARAPVLAILGAVGCAIFHQLPLGAFVSSAPSLSSAGDRAQSRVILAASKAEIAEAEKHAKLLTWAAKTAAEKGAPQAAAMQAKADQAVKALAALKQQQASGAPPAPAVQPTPAAPAAMDTITRTVMSTPVMVEEIAEMEKQVRLLTWAAKTAAEKGMPQAAAAQARAAQAAQQLMQMKDQQEAHQGGRSVTTPPAASMPAPAAAAVAAAPAAASAASKAEIAEAEKRAKLLVWAAKTAAEQGAPQAAAMQAKADQAVQALAALKQQQASRPAPPVVPAPAAAPVAAAPASPAASSSAPTRGELEQAKKDMNLLVWAAKTAAQKGMPQAAMMKAKADAKAQEYEHMAQQLDVMAR